jgi:ribosomal protein L7/L12
MDLENQVRTMLAQNQRIEAIKWVRHQTGWGLKRSKDYVDEIAREILPSLPAEKEAALDREVNALFQQGVYIEAIKRVREVTGWGLRECKDYVDRLSSSTSASEAMLVPSLPRGRSPDLSRQTISQVRALLEDDRKVEAVRLVRTMAGVGLRKAKEYVDSLEAQGDLEDEEPIDEQEELTRLRAEAAHLMEEVDLLRAERAHLEREHDLLLGERGRSRARSAQVSKRGKVRRNAPCPCGSGKKYKNFLMRCLTFSCAPQRRWKIRSSKDSEGAKKALERDANKSSCPSIRVNC